MKVYLDNSATTRLDPEVLQAMMPYLTDDFGNANSQHSYGQAAAVAVSEARKKVAAAIGAKQKDKQGYYKEIYFTSGGTEADNWALKGVMYANKDKGNHLIVSKIEHAAVLASAKQLEKEGFSVTYLDVDANGIVDMDKLKAVVTDKTVLISVMLANNEIGTIQPIKQISAIAKSKGILLHTDAVQAIGSIPVNVDDLGVDLLSLSAHKFHGPKGIGALYVRNGVKISKLVTGGEQERTMRGGTTNVAAVVGLGRAIELAVAGLEKNSAGIKSLRDYFVARVEKEIPYVIYNGDRISRLPQNANFCFEYIEGEGILLMLDLSGIAVSSGSACSSSSLEPSHVMLAIGRDHGTAHGSIRFSFGKYNTKEEVDYTIDILSKTVANLRAMSPLFVNKGDKKYV